MTTKKYSKIPSIFASTVLFLTSISGCGDTGLNASGVGSGGTGLADGAISGFGSIIIDGVSYNDSQAKVFEHTAFSSNELREAKLGQRARITFTNGNIANQIEIIPLLSGTVDSPIDNMGYIQIMGNTVKIINQKDNQTQSQPTILSGYSNSTDITAGDEVTVHGDWILDKSLGKYILIATRIEKNTQVMDNFLLSGIVTSSTGNTINVNLVTGQSVSINNTSHIALGNLVRFWITKTARINSTLTPLNIENLTPYNETSDVNLFQLNGLTSNFNLSTATVDIRGIHIKLNQADAVAYKTAFEHGEYTSITVQKANGIYTGSSPMFRSQASNNNTLGTLIEVKGIKQGIDWTQNPVIFNLRSQSISAQQTVIDDNCKTFVANTDISIEIDAQHINSAGEIIADSVECSFPQHIESESTEREGTLVSADTNRKTLTISTKSGDTTINWDDNTFFNQPLNTMIGKFIETQTVSVNGVLLAKKVKLE